MNIQEIQNAALGELLKLYAAAAAAHGEATTEGDHRAANKQHDIVAAIYRELRKRGPGVQRAMLGLLDHPHEAVRGWAAAHALEFAPEAGKPALESLATGNSIFGFTARVTLDEWKKGILKFP